MSAGHDGSTLEGLTEALAAVSQELADSDRAYTEIRGLKERMRQDRDRLAQQLQAKSKDIQDLELELVRAERRQTVYLDLKEQAEREAAGATRKFHAETLISNEYARRLREAWALIDEGLAIENTSVDWRNKANALRGAGDHLAINVEALSGVLAVEPQEPVCGFCKGEPVVEAAQAEVEADLNIGGHREQL